MKVPGRVLVLRAVAAADVSAHLAEAQVNPGVASLQTVFAAARARRDIAYLRKMLACRHDLLLPLCFVLLNRRIVCAGHRKTQSLCGQEQPDDRLGIFNLAVHDHLESARE